MIYKFLNPEFLDKDYSDLKNLTSSGRKINVLSMAESARPHAAASLGRFVLYAAKDRLQALAVKERLDCFLGQGKAAVLPCKDDFLIYKQGGSADFKNQRVSVFRELLNRRLSALVVSPEAFMQYLPSPEVFLDSCVSLKEGEDREIYSLIDALTFSGYFRAERISAAGEFALRGDVLDIWPVADDPVRINFFGDHIESIRIIDPEAMIGIREVKEITVCPASEILIPKSRLSLTAAAVESQEIPKGADRQRLKSVAAGAVSRILGGVLSGFDWIIPFARESFSDIFEWLPKDTAIVYDEPKIITERLKGDYKEFYERVAHLTGSGEIYPIHVSSAVPEATCFAGASVFSSVAFLNISSYNPIFMPDASLSMPSVRIPSYTADRTLLFTDLKGFLRSGKRAVLCCREKETAKAVYGELKEKFQRIELKDEAPPAFEGIIVAPLKIKEGFNLEKAGLAVIGSDELFGKEKRVLRSEKRKTGYIPAVSDYVVHDVHGIGRFAGIEKVKTGELIRDYGKVEYRDGQLLFVPVENLDKLSKYTGGSEPRLSKMGGAEFAKVKESVKKSVKHLAFSLLELYNRREKVSGYVYPEDSELQRLFEDGFEFDETDDQLSAIADIKKDLEEGRIMDRLLCGDAGYGKTEVALRAVFKVVASGKQAAILTPTTILARQHYNTVLARAKDFGLKVGMLSRFESKEEISNNLRALREGVLNIIVATHRLLSKDVSFYDLGLLVLDEEQRFGVEHKEKLKTIKNNVNVLTMTATPIPRTLHMALSGIRDISILETPPKNRIPVETYVTEYSEGLVRDAILREKSRGGQTFILYNRVETLDSFAYKISKMFGPEDDLRFIVAHGRMAGGQLDEKITAFYGGEADVLICTTIIENGIDLPNANTIIICEADKFGLSTLYQLRGRVGRSGQVAHAYFTYSPDKILNENAVKRLNAIMDYTDFGSGYKIAMRDLEIRGAGNVLGAEQHGHMEKVGYELYSRLLREAVSEALGEKPEQGSDTDAEVKIDADIDTYIEDAYVSGAEKIEVYGRIAAIDSEEKKEKYLAELTELYGKPKEGLINLMDIAYLKNMASKLGALKIMINSRGLGIVFNDTFFKREKLIKAIAKEKNMVLTGGESSPTLLFNVKNKTPREKLNILLRFISILSKSGS